MLRLRAGNRGLIAGRVARRSAPDRTNRVVKVALTGRLKPVVMLRPRAGNRGLIAGKVALDRTNRVMKGAWTGRRGASLEGPAGPNTPSTVMRNADERGIPEVTRVMPGRRCAGCPFWAC